MEKVRMSTIKKLGEAWVVTDGRRQCEEAKDKVKGSRPTDNLLGTTCSVSVVNRARLASRPHRLTTSKTHVDQILVMLHDLFTLNLSCSRQHEPREPGVRHRDQRERFAAEEKPADSPLVGRQDDAL